MAEITEHDIVFAFGVVDDLIIREALRTKVSRLELRRAIVLLRKPVLDQVRAGHRLAPRVKRLIDLLSVALSDPSPSDGAKRRTAPQLA